MNSWGQNNPNWRGGRRENPKGYVKVYAPGHPRAVSHRYVMEHILVMEKHLDRYLIPGEEVHHRNGVKNDNRIENLELWAVNQPRGQRVEDLVAWAHEVLARYATFATGR